MPIQVPTGYGIPNNGCRSVHGSEVKYRLRIAANNGITRNGVEASQLNDFETFFQLATSSGLNLLMQMLSAALLKVST